MATYDSSEYRKHKRPKGWGSLCPDHVRQEDAQRLLDSSVSISCEKAVYNISGKVAYRAFPHGPDAYHGHPIPWSRLPAAAQAKLIQAGRLDVATLKTAIRKQWGREFDQ